MQDDGFHEIQLNGKQLVFLFMAATVVSVVIFLCGVLVGRGVRAERTLTDVTPITSEGDPTPAPAPPPSPSTATPPPAGSDPTAAAAPPANDELSYFSRLEKPTTPQEKLKPPAETKSPEPKPPAAARDTASTSGKTAPAPEKTTTRKQPAAEKKEAAAAPKEPAPAVKEAAPALKEPPAPPAPAPKEPARTAADDAPPPSGDGFAVQIAALNVRSEADAIAKRLSSKGYAAYVLNPANGTPAVYRVRIGKFPTKREAESVAARLQKEEQFKPWVTR